MKSIAGVWIDHRKAVIAIVSNSGEETLEIRSNVEKHLGRTEDGAPSMAPFEAQLVRADDSHEREYMGHLGAYYSRVIEAIHHAECILIMGPGEAKFELRKQFDRVKFGGNILPVETTDKLTDRQIVAKVREHLKQPVL